MHTCAAAVGCLAAASLRTPCLYPLPPTTVYPPQYQFTITWPSTWSAKGYQSFVFGFPDLEVAAQWHCLMCAQLEALQGRRLTDKDNLRESFKHHRHVASLEGIEVSDTSTDNNTSSNQARGMRPACMSSTFQHFTVVAYWESW